MLSARPHRCPDAKRKHRQIDAFKLKMTFSKTAPNKTYWDKAKSKMACSPLPKTHAK